MWVTQLGHDVDLASDANQVILTLYLGFLYVLYGNLKFKANHSCHISVTLLSVKLDKTNTNFKRFSYSANKELIHDLMMIY